MAHSSHVLPHLYAEETEGIVHGLHKYFYF